MYLWAFGYTADMDCGDWNSLSLARAAAILGYDELLAVRFEAAVIDDADLEVLLDAGIDINYQQSHLDSLSSDIESMVLALEHLVIQLEGNCFTENSLEMLKQWSSIQLEAAAADSRLDACFTNYLLLTVPSDNGEELWESFTANCPTIGRYAEEWKNDTDVLDKLMQDELQEYEDVIQELNVHVEQMEILLSESEERLAKLLNGGADGDTIRYQPFVNAPDFVPVPSWYDTADCFYFLFALNGEGEYRAMSYGTEPEIGKYNVVVYEQNVSSEEIVSYVDSLKEAGASVEQSEEGDYYITYGTSLFAVGSSDNDACTMTFFNATDVIFAPSGYFVSQGDGSPDSFSESGEPSP